MVNYSQNYQMASYEELQYSPTKRNAGGRSRGRRGSDASLWSSRTYSAKSRAMSETNLRTVEVPEKIRKQRRNTYVIDKVIEDRLMSDNNNSGDLFSTTLHTGGIKALLDKANKGQDFVFPPEIRDYISSHFRMIRDENLKLNQSLDSATNELNRVRSQKHEHKAALDNELRELRENLKATNVQLDRERAKNRGILKKLKNGSNADDQEIIWLNQDDSNKEEMPRPATTASNFSGKDPNERKIKFLNKTLKSLRLENSKLERDNSNMRQVLVSELGNEDEVERALHAQGPGDWEGRASKIASLQAQLDGLRNQSDHSQSSTPIKIGGKARGSGDGSSRQGSLTPLNLESSFNASNYSDSREALKTLQIKYEEATTVRKVSEVERERLGEHVRVLTKRLRSSEEAVVAAEAALRSERKQTASLQKMLEKAHVELRHGQSANSTQTQTANSSLNGSEVDQIREELTVTQEQLAMVAKKREEDLDMFLKLAADSKRMFSQALKESLL